MNIPAISGYQTCTSPSCAYNKGASATRPPITPEKLEKPKGYDDLEHKDMFVKSESGKTEGCKTDKCAKLGIMHSAGGGTN